MNTPNSRISTSAEQQLLSLAAGFAGLRKFVLERHVQTTGEPMNKAELRLDGYIDAELDRLIAQAAQEVSPAYAAILDFRNRQPPQP